MLYQRVFLRPRKADKLRSPDVRCALLVASAAYRALVGVLLLLQAIGKGEDSRRWGASSQSWLPMPSVL